MHLEANSGPVRQVGSRQVRARFLLKEELQKKGVGLENFFIRARMGELKMVYYFHVIQRH